MSIYVWSDTHFNHESIIKYCDRAYETVEAMNQGLIHRWNIAVKPTDTVFLVGDFGFGKNLMPIFEALHGHKHLVRGNHDERNPAVLKLPWQSQSDLVTLKENKIRVIACHYPLETWKSAHKGYLHVHGHSHGTLKHKIPHRYDVGTDVEYMPVDLTTVHAWSEQEKFEATDHHGDL